MTVLKRWNGTAWELVGADAALPGNAVLLDANGKVPIAQLPIGSTSLILPTTGKPANSVGQDADQAIDRAAKMIYAKSAGAWDAGALFGGAVDPSRQGVLGWSADPGVAGNSFGLSNGVLYLVRFTALLNGVIGNIGIGEVTLGSGLTAAGNWLGLYDTGQLAANTLTLLASVDATSAFGSVTGAYKLPIAGVNGHTAAVIAGQDYYLAFLANGTTPPLLSRAGSLFGLANLGFSGPLQWRAAQLAAVGLTLPATVTATLTQSSQLLVGVALP